VDVRTWLFQANPQHYRIDDALSELAEIRWRTPQHYHDLEPDDLVVVWRSGPQAGVIGIGRIRATFASAPALPEERPYAHDKHVIDRAEPRASVEVAPVPWIPKDQVFSLASWREHQLRRFAQGTVFAVTEAQFAELLALLQVQPGSRATRILANEVEASGTNPAASGTSGSGTQSTNLVAAPSVAVGHSSRPHHEPALAEGAHRLDELASNLLAAARDSANPGHFEALVAEAFRALGFDASHLGGPGRTDVIVEAPLPAPLAYSIAVDAKTSARGARSAAGIDFETLSEHRDLHQATYSALLLPGIEGVERLQRRAEQSGTTLILVDDLVELLDIHAKTPLGPLVYRNLFENPGLANLQPIREAAQKLSRLGDLTAAVVSALIDLQLNHAERTVSVDTIRGRLLADPRGLRPSSDDVQAIVEFLSHPLVAAVEHRGEGVCLLLPPATLLERLGWLTTAVTGAYAAEPPTTTQTQV
jgi:hypothetical protein